jgi:beta-N-acetylhexosaminidase
MRKIVILLFCIIFVLSFAACNKESNKIGIRGEITKISTNPSGNITNIFVEGKIEQDTGQDKASISITEKTKIYEAEGNKKLDASSLKEGIRVEVIFEGPIRTSYPVQADAKIIRVLK